jgi:fructosamine-3-kinase
VQDVIYDSSACYAHNEYELGIMKMFGGFGSGFLKEYHDICPKSEPVEEYDDRIALYELYHHLNHHVSITLQQNNDANLVRRHFLVVGTEEGLCVL